MAKRYEPYLKDCIIYKKCTTCFEDIPFNNMYFYEEKRNKSGLKGRCKRCFNKDVSSRERVYTEEQKIKERENAKKRVNRNKQRYLEKWKEYKESNRDKISIQKSEYAKRECVKKRMKELRRTKKYWKTRNERRKSLKIYNYTMQDFKHACDYFDNVCAYCGISKYLCMDHVIPLSKGGTSEIKNILPSCVSCNCRKHTQEMDSWYKKQKTFSQEKYEKIKTFINNN
jgi:5-methylcytosine-specific restriction endonuclease McrA